jgi:hypothetical protein
MCMSKLFFPGLTLEPPKERVPFVPIYVTSSEFLKHRRRVLIIINDDCQDLGVLSYRIILRGDGITAGSVLAIVKELKRRSVDSHTGDTSNSPPGLVVMNPGQLRFDWTHNQPITLSSWNLLSKESLLHHPPRVSPDNIIPKHASSKEHIRTVFKEFINNRKFIDSNAELYVIAIDNGGSNFLEVLQEDCKKD